MHAVYFFRPLPRPWSDHAVRNSEELRYSLRSIAVNLAGLDQVHVFGGRPPWLSDHVVHHPVKQPGVKHDNTWAVWTAIADACRAGDLPDEFLMMNDDYFAMQPVTDVPAYSRWSTSEWAVNYRTTPGGQAMARTIDALVELGVPVEKQREFELHVPLPVHGPTLARVWPALDEQRRRRGRLVKRSGYANLAGLNQAAVDVGVDVKVRRRDDPLPAGAWWSTADDTFRWRSVSRIGTLIRATFAVPSRFETARATVARSTKRAV